jgi:DNA-binding CsgD family transcriptional regulator
MQLISVEDPRDANEALLSSASSVTALSGLIGSIGTESFGAQGLQQLNRWLPAAWWAIYRLFDDSPPVLHALGSVGVVDRTRQSWQVYKESLYRFDESFQVARGSLQKSRLALLHRHSSEIPHRHRAEIYGRNGLTERLSIVTERAGSGLLAINLFRHESQPAFSDEEIEQVRCASPLVMSCVERHIAVQRQAQPGAGVLEALPMREREVCQRMLKGWTHEGIAADLGISAGTVKTYRDRAFEKLGIHHRNELFALVLAEMSTAS